MPAIKNINTLHDKNHYRVFIVAMDQPQVSVKAWNNYNHWDKNKGGLQVEIKDAATVRRERLRKKILIAVLITVIVLVLLAILIAVIITNLPEPEVVTRGT